MTSHDRDRAEPLEPFTEDELAALALAADVDTPVSDDAIPLAELLGTGTDTPLPSWYMPAPMGTRPLNGWHGRLIRCSAFSVIAAFVAINAYGLCNTYGQLHF